MAKMRRPIREGSAATPRYRTQLWAAEQADPRAVYEAAQRPGIGVGLNNLFKGVQKAGKNLQRQQDEADEDWFKVEQQRMGIEALEWRVKAHDGFGEHGDPVQLHADLVSASIAPINDRLALPELSSQIRSALELTKKVVGASAEAEAAAQVHQLLMTELDEGAVKLRDKISQAGRTDFSAAAFEALLSPYRGKVALARSYMDEESTISSTEYMKKVDGAITDSVLAWVESGSKNLQGAVSAIKATAEEGGLRKRLLAMGADPETVAATMDRASDLLVTLLNSKDGIIERSLEDARVMAAEMGGEEFARQQVLAQSGGESLTAPLAFDAPDPGPYIDALQEYHALLEKNPRVQSWYTDNEREDLKEKTLLATEAVARSVEARGVQIGFLNGAPLTPKQKRTLTGSWRMASITGGPEAVALVNDFDAFSTRLGMELRQNNDTSLAVEGGGRRLTDRGYIQQGKSLGDKLIGMQELTGSDGLPFMLAEYLEARILAAADDPSRRLIWLSVINSLEENKAKDLRAKPEATIPGQFRVFDRNRQLITGPLWSSTPIGNRIKAYNNAVKAGGYESDAWAKKSEVWESVK